MSRQETSELEAESRLKREVASGIRPATSEGADLSRERAEAVPVGRPQDIARELTTLALPIAAAMLGETALGLIDTKLVGGLGTAALGGVGVATTIMFLFYSLVFGLMRGVKVLVAHAVGAHREHDAFAYARAGVVMGASVGVAIFVLCRDVGPVLVACGIDPTIVPFAREFLAAITVGAPATCALTALIQHRQAIGDSRTPMIVGIGGNVFNAVVAWSLIYGHFGLPALGVRGGGYATAATEVLELAIMGGLLLRHERRRRARGGAASALSLGHAAREVAGLGVPTGLQFGLEMLAFTTFTAVIGGIGRPEIAAHQIALAVLRVSFLPGLAVSEAASVLVGQALGRGRAEEAELVTKHALKLAVGFMALCGLVFAFGGGFVAKTFSEDAEVTGIARRLLLVGAVFQVLDAVNMVLRGSLRGAKDVRVVAAIGIAAVWICVPTSAYFLGKVARMGAVGGWLGFIGETAIASALLWARWSRGSWRARVAPTTEAAPLAQAAR